MLVPTTVRYTVIPGLMENFMARSAGGDNPTRKRLFQPEEIHIVILSDLPGFQPPADH